MTANPKTLLVPALVVVAAFPGCGGGASAERSSGPGRSTLSRSEFVVKANAICKQANRQLDQAARKAYPDGEPTSLQVQQFLREHVIPAIEEEVARIRALPAPAGDAYRVNALLDATEQGARQAEANPNLLQAHGRRDPLFRGIKLARQYGLTVCARQ
jgi:hypothetical protein